MMVNNKNIFEIEGRNIGNNFPTYFIADIAANHDGDLERAKELIYKAAESGADAAKFQHFNAKTIVSEYGFKNMGEQKSHQTNWKKSVFEIYREASVSLEWTAALKSECDKAGITFFTSPYSIDIVDHIDPYVPAYKIGSGEITWIELIKYIASKGKPYILATGASTIEDIVRAVSAAIEINPKLCIMQCNTNYTASLENFKYINLNVLKVYRLMYPDLLLGLSDHTPGLATVLGAVALGARIIEKHFTDDTKRNGPDHLFSMDPVSWREMVDRTRELENSLGCGIKRIEDNEKETVILQRRAVSAKSNIESGTVLTREKLTVLRPCPADGIPPYQIDDLIGKVTRCNLNAGEHIKWKNLK